MSTVRLTRPRHPFEGQPLPVLGRMRRHGEVELLVVLPDGSKRLVPAAWTDLDRPPGGRDAGGGPATLGSVPDLLGLSVLVSGLSARSADDGEQAARKSPCNSVRTRNARLAAIHSLFGYAAVRHPEHAADIQRVLAIPPKRYDKALITYLAEDEITALLAAPDLATWTGRRDQALLMLACQTGLRATELTSLAIGDAHLGTGAHVSCLGKGRKQRITPLTPATVTVLRSWLAERGGLPADPLFITRRGTPLSRDALERRIAKYTAIAAESCPSLLEKKVSPHTLRHSAAMRLLGADVDTSVIALWMGHFSGVPKLWQIVSFRTDTRGECQTFWILCAM